MSRTCSILRSCAAFFRSLYFPSSVASSHKNSIAPARLPDADELLNWWSKQPPCAYCGIPVAWNPSFLIRVDTNEYVGSWIHSDGNKSCRDGKGVAWPVDGDGAKHADKPFWGYNMLARGTENHREDQKGRV